MSIVAPQFVEMEQKSNMICGQVRFPQPVDNHPLH